MNTRYAYCRCSTNEDKQQFSHQLNEILNRGVKAENIEYEYISGTKENKPKLTALLNKCNPGDSIVCYELSRLSRSMKDFNNIIDVIKEKKLRLELIMNNITVDFSKKTIDPFTNFFLNIMMAFNDLEVCVTKERVKSGLDSARARGVKLGRPKLNKENIPDKFYKYFSLYENKNINKVAFAKIMNWSRSKLDRYLKLLK